MKPGLSSGYAARCAVAALPHRGDHIYTRGCAPIFGA